MQHHGPASHHNPLHAAARQVADAAREAKSPLLEKVAVWAMIGSAITTAATALLHSLHMIRRDWKEDRRERERRSEAAPPPERPGHHTASADMPPHGDGGRWARREEHAHAARHAGGHYR
jgi:hypothetical protein